ncbi:MAG: hypothetical protein AB1422_12285 [bacterium]
MCKKIIVLVLAIGLIGVVNLNKNSWAKETKIKKVYKEEGVKKLSMEKKIKGENVHGVIKETKERVQPPGVILEIKGEEKIPGFKKSIIDKSQESISSKEILESESIPISNELPIPGFEHKQPVSSMGTSTPGVILEIKGEEKIPGFNVKP